MGRFIPSKPLLVGLSVCLISTLVFIGYVTLKGIDSLKSEPYVLGSAFLIIALLTLISHQSLYYADSAQNLAKRMAADILSHSRELFLELYRGSPVPYVLINARGEIESTNVAAVRLFHIHEGDLDTQNIFSLIESDTAQLVHEKYTQGLSVSDEEVQILRKDGTKRWVQLSLFMFRDSEKKHKGLLTLVDITKQKEIDKAKTEFVSLASHQLRTPISAMKWNIELLHTAKPSSFTPLQEEYLLKVAHGISRMELLVDDFLSVSKLELGTFASNIQEIEMNAFIHELLEDHNKKAESRGITIGVDVGESPCVIQSDTHLLTMIIGNLISNAIKYTGEGGSVHLSCDRARDHITIVVSDTGIGIPEDDHDQIFSKIFRAANARGTVADGTGLGLYIAREAARVLGGDITFVSKVDVGTTFTVVLPV